ncbi:MAG: hypothetical protein ACW986_06640 [Promethearchaeota archaeon]|jgi:hypothetical protein
MLKSVRLFIGATVVANIIFIILGVCCFLYGNWIIGLVIWLLLIPFDILIFLAIRKMNELYNAFKIYLTDVASLPNWSNGCAIFLFFVVGASILLAVVPAIL